MSRDSLGQALGGHLPSKSTLAPQTAFASLARAVRPMIRYAPLGTWERDTATLAGPLAAYRRRVRAFAERVVAPHALDVDAAPHASPGDLRESSDAVLRAAAREGLLSDVLPRPFGSADPRMLRWPLALPQTLKTEELACADGGLMLLICAHALGITPVVLSGDLRMLRRVLLPALKACDAGRPTVFAYAITEPSGGSDVEHGHGAATYKPGVVAKRTSGGWRLTGRKCFISGGDIARYVCVFAALEHEGVSSWTAFLVRANAPGFRAIRTEL